MHADLPRHSVRIVVGVRVVLHLEHLRLGRERLRGVRVAQEAGQRVREQRCNLRLVQYRLYVQCICMEGNEDDSGNEVSVAETQRRNFGRPARTCSVLSRINTTTLKYRQRAAVGREP